MQEFDITDEDFVMHTSRELKKEINKICWEMVEEQSGKQVGKYFYAKSAAHENVTTNHT